VRRLQRTGQSTFIVSLPKNWVEEMKLGKGDLVTIAKEMPNCSVGWNNNIKVGHKYPVVKSSAFYFSDYDVICISVAGMKWWIPYECVAVEEQLLFNFMYD